MKRLVLVRHATAVDVGPKGSDFHRRLKKRGRREAAIMADRIAVALGTSDALVSSPADRAIETARVFAGRLGFTGQIIVREHLYGGLLPEEFLHIVRELDDTHDTVMVFGHDPSFSEFASYLVAGFKELIPKAGVVAIDVDRKSWNDVSPGDGIVALFERPPAPEIQKRIEEDLIDRLSMKIRTAVFDAIRSFGVPENRDVVKSVARASARLAVTVRPFAASGSDATAPRASGNSTRGRALTKKRAKKAAKGPRRVASTRVKRRTRSRA
jgi:phosphohistidine phosphatase